MKMNKRVICFLLAVTLCAGFLAAPVCAAEARSSDYLSTHTASLRQGSGSGEIDLTYFVRTNSGTMTYIGISKIEVYRSGGGHYMTINGSTANGLLKASAVSVSGTYTIHCAASTSYYCVVTFIAQNASGTDTRTVTTASAIAHP